MSLGKIGAGAQLQGAGPTDAPSEEKSLTHELNTKDTLFTDPNVLASLEKYCGNPQKYTECTQETEQHLASSLNTLSDNINSLLRHFNANSEDDILRQHYRLHSGYHIGASLC